MAMQLTCPHCRATLTFNQAICGGSVVSCLSCNRAFSVPAASVAPPVAARPRPVVSAAPQTAAGTRSSVPRAAAAHARPAARDEAPAPAGGNRLVAMFALAVVALLFLGGLALAVYVAVSWQRLHDSPPPVLALGPKDKADKDQAEKDAGDKDQADKGPGKKEGVPPDSGSKDAAKPAGKDNAVTIKDPTPKDSKAKGDGSVDVADLKPQDKQPPPVVADPPIKPPEKDKGKKIETPEVPIVIPAPTIAPGVTAADIDKAVDRGVDYLKKTFQGDALWGAMGPEIGYGCLAGLALLECKVSAKDPMIHKLAQKVRERSGGINDTYQASLAVLFLDKLGDPNDDALIRGLGLRILAGQMESGEWAYNFNKLDVPEMTGYHGFLRGYYPWSMPAPRPKNAHQLTENEGKKGAKPPAKGQPIDLNDLPKDAIHWKAKLPKAGAILGGLGEGDNSNTQFALLALWAARRHDVPAECPILLSYQRFRAGQNADGGWGYRTKSGNGPAIGEESNSTNTMTCAGLLGLALGPGALPAGSNVGDKDKIQEPVARGLAALGGYIGTPAPAGTKPPMQNMYFLWSVERVGVLFDLKTIGGKDWYAWGAQILVANQHDDGSWSGAEYRGASPHLDTCFALLFLKRANLVADLTENLKVRMVIRDPGAK